MKCRDTQISRMAARSLAEHSRHADLRKVSNRKHPSTQKYLAGPSGAHPTGQAGRAYKSTPTSGGHASNAPN
jgi:hypothetical protein